MRKVVALFLLLTGCATPSVKREPLFRADEIVEARPLPKSPRDTDLGTYPGDEHMVTPISKGEPAPYDGILDSERRSARDSEFRSRYDELRVRFDADRAAWGAQRRIYEAQLDLCDQTIRSLQPTWYDLHKAEIALVTGLVLGAGATIGIAYAVGGAR